MKRFQLYFASIALLTFFFDQLTKWLVLYYKPLLDFNFLEIHLIWNTGAGFGILKGHTFLLGIVSLLVFGGVLYYYKEIPKQKWIQTFFALFLGGVAGNLLDRFFRQGVVDFIDFSFWPAFNIADSAIVIAVGGIIWHYIQEERNKKH